MDETSMIQEKTDSQIQQEVLRELRWDTRVDETEIGVTAEDGVVTLRGSVDSYGKRVAAQEAAHRVTGVLDVANDIEVKPADGMERNDTEIAQAVRRALLWDVWIPEDRIQSTVTHGWVTLEGLVSVMRERNDAERAVRHLAGVRGVTNRILVSPADVESDDVRLVIEDALERRAEREADRIKVAVSDGAVTLTGKVRSWQEKRAVMGAVSHARGVRSVKDQLIISPYA
jgi:osmotically-inducible protein OsmY